MVLARFLPGHGCLYQTWCTELRHRKPQKKSAEAGYFKPVSPDLQIQSTALFIYHCIGLDDIGIKQASSGFSQFRKIVTYF